jgi:hypothetical protein
MGAEVQPRRAAGMACQDLGDCAAPHPPNWFVPIPSHPTRLNSGPTAERKGICEDLRLPFPGRCRKLAHKVHQRAGSDAGDGDPARGGDTGRAGAPGAAPAGPSGGTREGGDAHLRCRHAATGRGPPSTSSCRGRPTTPSASCGSPAAASATRTLSARIGCSSAFGTCISGCRSFSLSGNLGILGFAGFEETVSGNPEILVIPESQDSRSWQANRYRRE